MESIHSNSVKPVALRISSSVVLVLSFSFPLASCRDQTENLADPADFASSGTGGQSFFLRVGKLPCWRCKRMINVKGNSPKANLLLRKVPAKLTHGRRHVL